MGKFLKTLSTLAIVFSLTIGIYMIFFVKEQKEYTYHLVELYDTDIKYYEDMIENLEEDMLGLNKEDGLYRVYQSLYKEAGRQLEVSKGANNIRSAFGGVLLGEENLKETDVPGIYELVDCNEKFDTENCTRIGEDGNLLPGNTLSAVEYKKRDRERFLNELDNKERDSGLRIVRVEIKK